MNYWQRLTAEEASTTYNIELQYARNERNRFYAGESRPDKFPYAGPFPFFAIVNNAVDQTATLHIATIEEEDISVNDTKYNPLSVCSQLLFMGDMCGEFVHLLRDYANTLKSMGSSRGGVFQQIKIDNLPFKIDEYSRRFNNLSFYIYEGHPFTTIEHKHKVSFIELSNSKEGRGVGVEFGIDFFDKNLLEKEDICQIDIAKSSISKIILNQSGFLELANLIEKHC